MFFCSLRSEAYSGWMQLYGFDWNSFSSVQLTKDGGYIAGGSTNCTGDWSGDPFLVKVNSVGNTLWEKTFIDTFIHYYANKISCVIETSDSNYIVVGFIGSYAWVAKITPLQNTLWSKVFARDTIESYFFSVVETDDKNYLIGGLAGSSHDRYDAWLVKMSSDGDTLWTKKFGQTGIDENIFNISKTMDGNYVLAGATQEFSPPYYCYVWLYKVNSSGDSIWRKDYKDSLYYREICSVIPTVNGGYLFTGRITPNGEGQNTKGWFVKTGATGEIIWTKTLGDSFSNMFCSARQTYDKGYILTGHTYSYGAGYADIWLVKTDSLGDTTWMRTFGDSTTCEGANDVQLTTDGGYILCGDYWERCAVLIKTDSLGNVAVEESSSPKSNPPSTTLRVNQNPFSQSTLISYSVPPNNYYTNTLLTIYDLSGRCAKTLINEQKPAGSYSITLSANDLKTGVYFVKLKTGNYNITKKLILMK